VNSFTRNLSPRATEIPVAVVSFFVSFPLARGMRMLLHCHWHAACACCSIDTESCLKLAWNQTMRFFARSYRRFLEPCRAWCLLFSFVFLLLTTVVNSRLHQIKKRNGNSDIVVTKIKPEDEDHARRLLSCNDYQYRVRIRDELYMYYVANPNTKTMKMKLEYFGNAWISLGINEDLVPGMIGSEAWMALTDVPVSFNNPGVYSMAGETAKSVVLSSSQMLFEKNITQANGITTATFSRKYTDFFFRNQRINATGPNEFLWAYGASNQYSIHKRAGHFTMTVDQCFTPKTEIENIEARPRICGFFSNGIFCPFTFCGLIGRLIGLCKQ
jgi:hypothetical protein